ncbi:MAG: glutamate racemase [Gaiellales bacterium]|nr:glutamate racemase [Gaiellales bacterium]
MFDSGVGGLSVANAIEAALPGHDVVFRNDAVHVPYGNRELDEIYELGAPVVRRLIDEDGAQVVVIACNTVTTNFIGRLREELTVPLVGMEPSVKPAAQATRTGTITVCATPRTLESPRYAWLKETFASSVRVLEPDCSDWSSMIESNRVNSRHIAEIVDSSIAEGSDQIVLGCTHYHWIEDTIRAAAGARAVVLQPEQPVIEQLRRVLAS